MDSKPSRLQEIEAPTHQRCGEPVRRKSGMAGRVGPSVNFMAPPLSGVILVREPDGYPGHGLASLVSYPNLPPRAIERIEGDDRQNSDQRDDHKYAESSRHYCISLTHSSPHRHPENGPKTSA